jgi:hypothetical protein
MNSSRASNPLPNVKRWNILFNYARTIEYKYQIVKQTRFLLKTPQYIALTGQSIRLDLNGTAHQIRRERPAERLTTRLFQTDILWVLLFCPSGVKKADRLISCNRQHFSIVVPMLNYLDSDHLQRYPVFRPIICGCTHTRISSLHQVALLHSRPA